MLRGNPVVTMRKGTVFPIPISIQEGEEARRESLTETDVTKKKGRWWFGF